MKNTDIIAQLPYTEPFLFVDELAAVSEEGAAGAYTFKEDAYFYKGHFKDNPITPGVILTECMAQIGLVCLGIYLFGMENSSRTNGGQNEEPTFVLSNTEIDFYLPVFPGEKITVTSKKIYFRFQKLKCSVLMKNSNNETVCKGTISGMITPNGDEK